MQEIAKNSGERSFQQWLAESPHTVHDLSVERGLYFSGLILTKKDEVGKKTLTLNVALDIPVRVGDIMNWNDGATKEKWLIYKKERKVNGTYQTFDIIRCNYYMKWIDKEGILQGSWAYFTSSLDSKIKENFRTWNHLITPQPNKYAELIMPLCVMDKMTKFIVGEEAWYAVEYDNTSVSGIIYISMTEDKVNSIYDDVEEKIANMDTLAHFKIVSSENIQSFNIGEEIKPVFSIMKNDKVVEESVVLTSTNKKIARMVDGVLTAAAPGEVDIIVQLERYPQIQMTQKVNIQSGKEFSAYIEGNSSIRLDRQITYELKANEEITGVVDFSLNDNILAAIVSSTNDSCVVKANDRNKLGSVVLTAVYNGKSYEKEINIIPLW